MTVPILEGILAICVLYPSVRFVYEQWRFYKNGDIVSEALTLNSAMIQLLREIDKLSKRRWIPPWSDLVKLLPFGRKGAINGPHLSSTRETRPSRGDTEKRTARNNYHATASSLPPPSPTRANSSSPTTAERGQGTTPSTLPDIVNRSIEHSHQDEMPSTSSGSSPESDAQARTCSIPQSSGELGDTIDIDDAGARASVSLAVHSESEPENTGNYRASKLPIGATL